MNRWFRMYNEVLDDPKVQRLPLDAFKAWVNLLCQASRQDGRLGPVTDLAFALRIAEKDMERIVSHLIDVGLLDRDRSGNLSPHNWRSRQAPSDSAAARTAAYRERKRARDDAQSGGGDVAVTAAHRHGDVTVTAMSHESDGLDSDSDIDEKREEEDENTRTSVRVLHARPRATRTRKGPIPENFHPDTELAISLGLTPEQVSKAWEKFESHYRANGTTKADWQAAWKFWVQQDAQHLAPPAEEHIGAPGWLAVEWIAQTDPLWRGLVARAAENGEVVRSYRGVGDHQDEGYGFRKSWVDEARRARSAA